MEIQNKSRMAGFKCNSWSHQCCPCLTGTLLVFFHDCSSWHRNSSALRSSQWRTSSDKLWYQERYPCNSV
jgi:hypothetical protein